MNLVETLPTLLLRTQEGKLKWEEFGTNSFMAQVGGVFLSIQSMGVSYRISLLNEAGTTLESDDVNSFGSLEENFEQAKELHTLARRQALKIDAAFDQLKKGLDSL